MARPTTYIKLDRNILKWGWYTDSNTKAVFIHFLLSANIKDTTWSGETIRRGQLVASREKLAKILGLTVNQIRTAIEHLKSTGEITVEWRNRYTIITIVKYDVYQSGDSNPGKNPGKPPAKTPAETPAETPARAPANRRTEPLVNTGDSRFSMIGSTPAETPSRTPAETPAARTGEPRQEPRHTLLKNNKRIKEEKNTLRVIDYIARTREEVETGAYQPKPWEENINKRFWGRFGSEAEYMEWWCGER